jgi:hypothetical protein
MEKNFDPAQWHRVQAKQQTKELLQLCKIYMAKKQRFLKGFSLMVK